MIDEFEPAGPRARRRLLRLRTTASAPGCGPGCATAFGSGASGGEQPSFEDMQERMLFAEALETVRCLEEGVLTSVADANIGSILGIGFPAWTGGVLQYINQYAGGLAAFVARAEELAKRYGDRFAPPALLRGKAASGERFA